VQYFFDAQSEGIWQAMHGIDIDKFDKGRDARKARSSQNEAVLWMIEGQTGADGHEREFTQSGRFLCPDILAQVSEERAYAREFGEHSMHHQRIDHELADGV
jgi:hypothetical protein